MAAREVCIIVQPWSVEPATFPTGKPEDLAYHPRTENDRAFPNPDARRERRGARWRKGCPVHPAIRAPGPDGGVDPIGAESAAAGRCSGSGSARPLAAPRLPHRISRRSRVAGGCPRLRMPSSAPAAASAGRHRPHPAPPCRAGGGPQVEFTWSASPPASGIGGRDYDRRPGRSPRHPRHRRPREVPSWSRPASPPAASRLPRTWSRSVLDRYIGDAGAPGAGQPVERSPPGRPLPEAVNLLGYVGWHREATRRQPSGCVARIASCSSAAWSTPASSPRSGTARAVGPTGIGSPPSPWRPSRSRAWRSSTRNCGRSRRHRWGGWNRHPRRRRDVPRRPICGRGPSAGTEAMPVWPPPPPRPDGRRCARRDWRASTTAARSRRNSPRSHPAPLARADAVPVGSGAGTTTEVTPRREGGFHRRATAALMPISCSRWKLSPPTVANSDNRLALHCQDRCASHSRNSSRSRRPSSPGFEEYLDLAARPPRPPDAHPAPRSARPAFRTSGLSPSRFPAPPPGRPCCPGWGRCSPCAAPFLLGEAGLVEASIAGIQAAVPELSDRPAPLGRPALKDSHTLALLPHRTLALLADRAVEADEMKDWLTHRHIEILSIVVFNRQATLAAHRRAPGRRLRRRQRRLARGVGPAAPNWPRPHGQPRRTSTRPPRSSWR